MLYGVSGPATKLTETFPSIVYENAVSSFDDTVTVYWLMSQIAVTVTFSAGIVAGIAGSHFTKEHPTFVGSAGIVIRVP